MKAWPVLCGAIAIFLATSVQAEEFSVLSYNTHGLPSWIAGDDPEARFPEIAGRTDTYDVVLLQEDFRHHELLRRRTSHATVRRGNQSLKSWCPFCSGSGLTLLVRWKTLIELANTAYGSCAGWIGGANDCLADKGFQIARLRLPGGAELSFVNTHLDAGTSDADFEARRRQLDSLGAAIAERGADSAVIVGGDFNLNAAVERDARLLRQFTESLGLANTGARARPGSDWSVLDYLFFRSGGGVTLDVLEAGEDESFVFGGAPLSDHPPIFARFQVRPITTKPSASSTSPRPPE